MKIKTKNNTETSININKTIDSLNNKHSEMMNDRGILATCLLSPLSKITNPDNTTQSKVVEKSTSNRVNGLLRHNSILITLHDNFLTVRDTNKEFELKGDLLKMITDRNYNVELASLSDKN